MTFREYLKERQEYIQEALLKCLPHASTYPSVIHEAMQYSLFAGGKRLRPLLVLAAGEAVGSEVQPLIPAACAVELVHTYSLIHDDLPCMDNDDFRRGRPTCHKVYGEAIALLAGDALLTQAFLVITTTPKSVPVERTVLAVAELAAAAGSRGMIGGQVVDLLSEGKQVDITTIDYIHKHKTGSMIKASLRIGAIIGGGSEEQVALLTKYGEKVGLAFQIKDDILDVEGLFQKTGKKSGMDVARGKATYPGCLGLNESREKAEELCREAGAIARQLGRGAQPLNDIAGYIIKRQE